MKILFSAAEAYPFVKTGGLADVVGALPKELKRSGQEVRVMIPLYSNIKKKYYDDLNHIGRSEFSFGNHMESVEIFSYKYEGIEFYFLDREDIFRDKPYGYDDDYMRFAFFSKAILESLAVIDYKPEVLHCNDWHTALVTLLLKKDYCKNPYFKNIRTVYTIHNLHYQGIFKEDILERFFDIEQKNELINYMEIGIENADIVNTVSPNYAEEIKGEEFGEGLDGVLREYSYKTYGILNGIDYTVYNPETDPIIYKNYGKNSLELKAENKKRLKKNSGLDIETEAPLLGIVSRLVEEKGIGLIIEQLESIVEIGAQIIVLGSGYEVYEKSFKEAEYKYKGRVKAYIGFDEEMSHHIYAGSDIFLMPSKLEPCGLSQLIALKYGTIPIVRKVGGLKDTVNKKNGFAFEEFDSNELLLNIKKAINDYKDRNRWIELMKNAMDSDHSWEKSARRYLELYREVSKDEEVFKKRV